MAFEDFKENLKNRLEQTGEFISNSRLYNSLRERYENFNSFQQKLFKLFAVLFVFGLAVYFPLDYFLLSFEYESSFESKRTLVKNIIKSEREIGSLFDIPRPLPAETVRSSIDSLLKELNFLPEQIKQVTINDQPTSSIIPANKIQYGIDVTINKINVKQLTNLGSKLQIIHPAMKMKDLIVTLNREDARYLDANIKLIALNIPEYKAPAPPPPENLKKKGKKPTKSDEDN